MPGTKGQRMIPRRSTSKKFHSVRELVFSLFEKNPVITKEECEKIVKKEYPTAKFIGKDGRSGHYAWYKHKWNRIKLENAHFNIKESHPKKEEDNGKTTSSNESKKGASSRAKNVDKNTVGKGSSGRKDRRVSIQPEKRRVVVKAREDVLQRKGNPENIGWDTEDTEVPD